MEAVTAGLVDAGRDVSIIDVGPDIFHVLERRRSELDLVFNNAEGPEEGELRTGSTADAYVGARIGRTSFPARCGS